MSFVHTALRLFTHIDQRQFLEEVVGTAPEQQRPPPAPASPPLHPDDDKNYGHKQRDSGHINCTLLKLNFHAINYLPTHYPAKRERGPAGGSWGLGVGDAEERWRCHFMMNIGTPPPPPPPPVLQPLMTTFGGASVWWGWFFFWEGEDGEEQAM
ncbi:hypothetical protein C0Q70_21437 [Pomacea canaliculata]|uniref:Uncharacterized protein n=1 Tax=Pomacea canaliculata TaxID=400727 RepID=A0A2T7NCH9_POMCA|nr:hypothetical protein C0Q70_21437 [Pomacea canaliculata]